MKIKKYVVENIKDAMFMIKRELGEDAVILQTRQIRKGGFLGIGARKLIEVTAVGEENKKRTENTKNPGTREVNEGIYKLRSMLAKNMDQNIKSRAGSEETEKIEHELKEIKDMILNMERKLVKHELMTDERFGRIYDLLKDAGFMDELIENVVDKLREIQVDDGNLRENLRRILLNLLKVDRVEFKKRDKIIFIGPTGVGKTTTLTKFATIFRMERMENDGWKIGMITLDTFKISGADQLKTYSDILGIPFKSFYTFEELGDSMDDLNRYDLLFIDTVGKSPKDSDYIDELRRMIGILKPTHIFLLLSVTTNPRDAMKIIEKFSICKPNHMILTKMDETESMSNLFNISFVSDIPISHVTNGQNIPDDIEELKPDEFIDRFLKEVLKDE